LILTFNLSLKNYIHDRINDVRENFYWDNFYITNYHQFFKSQANNHNIPIRNLDAWQDTNFFEGVKNITPKFKAVLIDEVQDYQTEWLEIITKYFLAPDGEFIVFGDEKQNIYDRPLDENKEPIIKTVVGRWNRSLNSSKRFTSNIASLAKQFQKEFFASKYNLDNFTVTQTALDFETKAIEYYYFEENWTVENVCKTMLEVIKKYSINPSNIGVLNSKVEYIRKLDYLLRQKTKEKTKTTFETQEVYDHLKKEIKMNNKDKDDNKLDKILAEKLEDIRKHKKNHFWMNTGTMKLSTIHSFKGWEIHSLFLLIENEDGQHEFGTNELIYTGLTRARINLFVFNLGNNKYDSFFKRYADNYYNR
jgi:superfamily I DNA/RNA helicase